MATCRVARQAYPPTYCAAGARWRSTAADRRRVSLAVRSRFSPSASHDARGIAGRRTCWLGARDPEFPELGAQLASASERDRVAPPGPGRTASARQIGGRAAASWGHGPAPRRHGTRRDGPPRRIPRRGPPAWPAWRETATAVSLGRTVLRRGCRASRSLEPRRRRGGEQETARRVDGLDLVAAPHRTHRGALPRLVAAMARNTRSAVGGRENTAVCQSLLASGAP